jgi:iron(III) transport system substrate-binding protein
MVTALEKATGIKVSMTRKSSGETYAQIKAEAANPRGDVWWGGTGDPHLQAAEEGLTESYKSPRLADLHPWAVKQAEASKYRTVGVYAGALGFSFNTVELAKRKLPEPKCWADLIKPEFKGEVQVANPNSSGTSYTLLATLVQIMGEDKAFDYLKAQHRNINQYTKSGAAPARAAATGESMIGITFLHDAVTHAVAGAPLKVVAPCEGTGYEIGSMSIIKGAKNMDAVQAMVAELTGPQAEADVAKTGSAVPGSKAAAELPEYLAFPPSAPLFYQTLPHTKAVPSPANFQEVEKIFIRYYTAVMSNEMQVADACKQADAELTESFARLKQQMGG